MDNQIKINQIKENPNNPRLIKDDKFKKLVNSIKEFPKMMDLRPIIINNDNMVLGGNMRLKALKELGYKEISKNWVKYASELTDEEQKRFIIADNVGFGEHDWDVLANDWDVEELNDWGLEIEYNNEVIEKKIQEIKPYEKTHILLSFDPDKFIEIRNIIENLYNLDFIEIEQSAN